MNTAVAAIERLDSRAIPQTPCPLVQPLPHTAPKPTSSPALTRSAILGVTAMSTAPRPSPNRARARR